MEFKTIADEIRPQRERMLAEFIRALEQSQLQDPIEVMVAFSDWARTGLMNMIPDGRAPAEIEVAFNQCRVVHEQVRELFAEAGMDSSQDAVVIVNLFHELMLATFYRRLHTVEQ